MTAVYGPGEVKVHKEIHDVEIVYKPKTGLPGTQEKTIEGVIKNTCSAILMTLYPRTSITVVVQELQNDGSLLACCLNSVCLALLDAGIEMKTTVASVNCAVDSAGNVALDPTKEIEEDAEALLTFAFDAKEKSIVGIHTSGNFTLEQYESCFSVAQKASDEIFSFFRNSVDKRYSKLKMM